jgi:DNA-binding LacI/PurR family transcriptional regulator
VRGDAATTGHHGQATIRDVARAAGVSVATVSRAYTEGGVVRDSTRERVLEAARRLGYRPNRAARGLITGRTGNIGLVVPDLANPYFHAVVKGAQARARRADYAVFIADSQEDAREETGLIAAMAKQVDGVVLCSPRMSEAALQSAARTATVVLLGRAARGLPAVTLDSADGMRQAVRRLVALGHRRIAYVPGPRRSWSDSERRRGLAEVAARCGVETPILGPVAPRFDGGGEAAGEVVASGATATVAFNDLVAAGHLHGLAAAGVRVPGEMSVVGFDDIPLAAMITPALTTVAMPTLAAGEAAVGVLLGRLEEGRDLAPDHPQVLPVALVERESTGPPGEGRRG